MTFHTRRLPHIHSIGKPIFITWRLHGSLPACRYFPPGTTSGQAFVAMDRLLDSARNGPLHLRRPEIANMTVEALHYHEKNLDHYDLHAYVIMANHVHILITPHVEVSKVMHSLKLFTGREANRALGLAGPFWQHESYDRLARDGTEFQRIVRYIERNPVHAGLVTMPEDFRWSSARPIDNRPPVGDRPHI